jgi:hypothetical protein
MKKILIVCAAAVFALGLWTANVQAQEEGKNYRMAVNLHPWGFVLGSYRVNYELLLGGMHGIMVEGLFQAGGGSAYYGGGLFYRLHFKKSMDSWFFSPFVKLIVFNGNTTINSVDYGFDYTMILYGANMGVRYVFGDTGVTVTSRLGWGMNKPISRAWENLTPTATDIKVVDALFTLLLGIDWELSVGYAF